VLKEKAKRETPSTKHTNSQEKGREPAASRVKGEKKRKNEFALVKGEKIHRGFSRRQKEGRCGNRSA